MLFYRHQVRLWHTRIESILRRLMFSSSDIPAKPNRNRMRNISSKIFALLALLSAIGLVTPAKAQLLWQVGRDDNGWPAGNGGGPNTSFVQENGVQNPLP